MNFLILISRPGRNSNGRCRLYQFLEWYQYYQILLQGGSCKYTVFQEPYCQDKLINSHSLSWLSIPYYVSEMRFQLV